jgi:drug/metabolite transporter (DMT)-like permease
MMTALFITLVVLGGSVGDVFITKGMKDTGEISTLRFRELAAIVRRTLSNRNFLAGIFFMAVSYFSFLAALARADLSLVLPATSASFVVTTVGAKVFLNERVTRLRWAGILLVCVGVALISIPAQP